MLKASSLIAALAWTAFATVMPHARLLHGERMGAGTGVAAPVVERVVSDNLTSGQVRAAVALPDAVPWRSGPPSVSGLPIP